MQEIAPHIYVENSYPGVTLGAINWPHGLLLIDAPFRPDDIRLWRTALQSMNSGIERLLVNLDDHYDRTLGARQIECMVVGHEKMTQIFRDRPLSFKPQMIETGSEWELYNSIGSTRWAPPEITFSERLEIHWDASPIWLESHPGPSQCAIWVVLPEQKIVFVGDTIMADEPPFLANADLELWKESLTYLQKSDLKNYVIVAGRGGVVTQNQVKDQMKSLDKIIRQIDKLSGKNLKADDIAKASQSILKNFDIPKGKEQFYYLRVFWGMSQYLRRQQDTTVEPAA